MDLQCGDIFDNCQGIYVTITAHYQNVFCFEKFELNVPQKDRR